MAETVNRQQWSQIAGLRPRLRQHVRTYPQDYRGARWYVLRDESSGQVLRFNAAAYAVIGHLTGKLTLQEIHEQLTLSLGDQAPSEEEMLQILVQLFAVDALRNEIPADTRALFDRYCRDRRIRWRRTLMNPLALRIPLYDPDRLVSRLLPWARPLFSPLAVVVWLLVVGIASLLALANAPALMAATGSQILSPGNLLLIGILFPIVKALHELSHALAIKTWGGEVHEMGITLLVLVPVPYVDASAAWAFRDRYKRVMVGAAGILTELFLAALALFIWLEVEPGLIRDAALNVFLISSISTLLFNGNPLVRFDGYYVLQDLIEIPNLSSRSSRYYLYLIQRYLFGLDHARSPVTAKGERGWFLFYGVAAFIYRLYILAVIALFLAGEYLVIGVALASWAIAMRIVFPILRSIRFVAASPTLMGNRLRAIFTTGVLLGLSLSVLLFLPVPLTTKVEGIVWLPTQSQLYAGTDGFVDRVLVPDGSVVEIDQPLLKLRSASLDTQIEVLEARHRELAALKAAEQVRSRVQPALIAEDLASVTAELERLQEQASALLVRSPAAGIFVLPEVDRIMGRYLPQGRLIGYVISPESLIVKSVVPQSDIGLVRQHTAQIQVQLAQRPGVILDASLVRATPSASKRLPSPALGAAGGGVIAVDMIDDQGLTASEKVFQLDLKLPPGLDTIGVGGRAYVRFDHGSEPLASQWVRSGRQLLLSRLSF